MMETEPAETVVVRTPEQLKAIADPLRQRLMRAFAEPATIKAAAERLGVPFGRLYHHVDQLEAAGLIRVVSERRRRATIERTFQAVAGAAMARAAVEQLLSGLSSSDLADGRLHMAQTTLRLTPEALTHLESALGPFLKSFESAEGRETPLLWIAAPRDPVVG
jgi:molybdenum-dependent DNA-binding transcriptional regulator ModE